MSSVKTTDMPRTAYSYRRVSSAEQMAGHGPARQDDGFRTLCQKKNWTLATEVYQDDGVSAFTGANLEHGDLGRFFADVRQGRVKPGSVLVVESLDRIIRPENIGPALRLWSAFIEAKISVASVIGERFYDAYNPDFGSTLMALVEMERGGNESRVKSDRLRKWWDQARRDHFHIRPPSWLRPKVNGEWPEIEDHVKIVKQIFKLCREGVSVERITAHLNQTKVKVISDRAKTWNNSYVRKILTTKSVIGEYTPHVGSCDKGKSKDRRKLDPIPGYYPAIITEDEFYEVQSLLAKRRKFTGPRGAKGDGPTSLFTGLTKDAWDGSVMNIGQKASDDPKLKMLVSWAAACGQPGSRYMSIRYPDVEAAVLGGLVELKAEDLMTTPTGDKLTSLEGRLKEVEANLHQIKARLKVKTTATLLDTAEQLEDERDVLRQQIDQTKAESAGSLAGHLTDVQELIRKAGKKDSAALRDKMKTRIGMIVESIWLYTFTHGPRPKTRHPQKWCYGQVYLKNGLMFEIGIKQGDYALSTTARYPAAEIDLREFDQEQADRLNQSLINVLERLHEKTK